KNFVFQVAYADGTVTDVAGGAIGRAGAFFDRVVFYRNDKTPTYSADPHGWLADPTLAGRTAGEQQLGLFRSTGQLVNTNPAWLEVPIANPFGPGRRGGQGGDRADRLAAAAELFGGDQGAPCELAEHCVARLGEVLQHVWGYDAEEKVTVHGSPPTGHVNVVRAALTHAPARLRRPRLVSPRPRCLGLSRCERPPTASGSPSVFCAGATRGWRSRSSPSPAEWRWCARSTSSTGRCSADSSRSSTPWRGGPRCRCAPARAVCSPSPSPQRCPRFPVSSSPSRW